MNTNGLAKLYDRLKPEERLPLMLAASARGDEAERDRLARSAPREGYWVPDFHGLAEALLLASMLHLLRLLDLAALYWQMGGLLEQWEAFADEDDDHPPPRRLRATVGMFAYVFTAKLDGWRRFCAGRQLDPEALMNDLPGYDTVKRTEEAARIMACTPEEAAAWLRERGDEAAQAPTAESVAASLVAWVENWEATWE
jgi:hypothetical protein